MAELGSTHYVGRVTLFVSPASSSGIGTSSKGLYYTRDSSNLADDGDGGTTYSVTVRPAMPLPRAVSAQLVIYRMRGRDVDCATLTYRYWNSVGAPDTSAALYTGPKCGVSALADVVVVDNVSS